MGIKKRLFKIFLRYVPNRIHKKIFSLSTILYCHYENFNYNFDDNGEFWLINSISKCSKQIFLDVGANIGNYSLKLSELFPKSSIYSFEPSPKTFKKLLENTKYSNNIFPINKALSKESKISTLYEFSPCSGRNTLDGLSNGIKYSDSYPVELSTGDIFVNQNLSSDDNISLLKIDVEGHELDVLIGFSETIKNNKIEIIQFERATAAGTKRIFEFYQFFKSSDYFIGKLYPNSIEIYENYWYGLEEYIGSNWIALRKKSEFINKMSSHIKIFKRGERKLITIH